MKQSEIALVALVAIISVLVAYFLGSAFLGDPGAKVTTIEYLGEIDGEIEEPSDEIFNAYAYNPTVEIYVGECAEGEEWDEATLSCVNPEENPVNPEEDDG